MSMWSALRNYLFFSSSAKKNFAKWHVYFSLLVQEPTVLLCSLEIPLVSSYDLTRLNLFELILPKKKTKNSGKIWFYNPQMPQSYKTTTLSNRVQYSQNTENQIYSSLRICSVIVHPSAITMTKSFCYHHRMTIFQNN